MQNEAKTEEKKPEAPPAETPKNGAPKGVPELNQEKEALARAAFFPSWSPAYLDLIKSQCCPPNIPTDQFAMFVEQCKRAELDPIKGEADCVPRNSKVKTRHPNGQVTEEWVTKWVFQPREAGMLARADRFPDYGGIEAAAVYEKDQITIDEAAGKVEHKWSPVGPRGSLVGAWSRVTRVGRKSPIEWLPFRDYAQDTAQWKSKPHTMIVKCARAAALRRAYPNTFGSSYVEGEKTEDELLVPVVETKAITDGAEKLHQTIEGQVSRTETVAAKVAAKAAEVAKPATEVAKPAPAPAPEPTGPVAKFGDKNRLYGKPLAGLSTKDLEELAALGAKSINEEGAAKKKWFASVRDNLVEINAEILSRGEPPIAKALEQANAPDEDEDAPF